MKIVVMSIFKMNTTTFTESNKNCKRFYDHKRKYPVKGYFFAVMCIISYLKKPYF